MSIKPIKKPNHTIDYVDDIKLREGVSDILSEIQNKGDTALFNFCEKYDGFKGDSLKITKNEIKSAYKNLDPKVIQAIKNAARRIEQFALIQKEAILPKEVELSPGITLGHNILPISSSASYVPGGRYPLPSSALMSIIPARVAGVERIVACSPPDGSIGTINPATVVAMDIAGATEIYCMGGAHAIGALAFGTQSITPADIIVGPGNQWVTEAKRQVSGDVGIDFIAGPSEVLVIADDTADPKFIAADLLAQSEHDPQARGILISTDDKLVQNVTGYLEEFLCQLQTAAIARKAWEGNGEIYLVDHVSEAVELSNEIAPEHLELHISNPETIIPKLNNYGSLFIGNWAAEVLGDYVSGTNHILPTIRAARYTGGVWVGTFLKVVSYQKITQEGARELAPVASKLAELEGLYAHKLAADLRR
ncbi:MAG: histidinol dehydrogenase [Tepidanaerobacteraceae bacterium]|nr:histidinol dehydrogenase [Tepidanaerobacteraceae bacterium]